MKHWWVKMIEFTNIVWKNLLSYGNNKTEFIFSKGINKISATNGSGKSSIIDALNYALFGKPYRKIKLSQLINSKNKKGMEVYLTFNKQDDVYRIERGLKPEFFRIFKNDELVPVSSSKKGYQEILEDDILGFNENLFNQVTVKSLTKNVSFMTLAKGEKRSIIENLFDIELFTIINKKAKQRADALDLTIKDTKKDIDNTTLLETQEVENLKNLLALQKKLKEESNQMIEGYNAEIGEIDISDEKMKKAVAIINTKKMQKNDKQIERKRWITEMSGYAEHRSEAKAKIESHEDKIHMLEGICGDCPKIKQLMEADDIERCHLSFANSELEIAKRAELVKTIDGEIKKMDEILANESYVTNTMRTNIERKEKLLNQIKMLKEKVITVDETKLKGYIEKKKILEGKYEELWNDKKHMTVLRSLFTDEGIKPLIIKKYLPNINKLLNTYLVKFNANMMFNFDSEFNEIILSKHQEDYSYFSFSEGEKKRIDLAVLFAFIKFAMHKNQKSNTNLLVFDEILSGLDVLGASSLFEILKEHKDYQNKCIITINHNADIDDEYFDKIYEVDKEKGFSRITRVN